MGIEDSLSDDEIHKVRVEHDSEGKPVSVDVFLCPHHDPAWNYVSLTEDDLYVLLNHLRDYPDA